MQWWGRISVLGQTINICHILPTQFHFYSRFPPQFCTSQCLVCLCVAYAVRQTHSPTDCSSNTAMNCFFVLSFSGADLWQMTSPYWVGEKWEGLRFCLCFPLRVERGEGSGVQHTSERNPTCSEQEQRSPRKHCKSKNKTLSMEMDIFTRTAPRRTTAE